MYGKRARVVNITMHPDVAEHMHRSFEKSLKMLERKFRRRIAVKGDPKLHAEDVYVD